MRTYAALAISDIHLSNKLPLAVPVKGGEGLTDRLQDQLELLRQVKMAAKRFAVQSIHCLGDVFDQARTDPIVLKHGTRALYELSQYAQLYIQGGNHDALSVSGGPYLVEYLDSLGQHGMHYASKSRDIPTPEWLRFWPIAYCSLEKARATLAEYRAEMKRGRRKCEVLLLHHSILGCKHEGWTCDVGLSAKEARQGFDWTFSGHFHTPQIFGKDKRGLYLGSPLHFRFDDAERKAGFWILTFGEDGSCERKFVASHLPKFRQLHWPERAPQFLREGDYVRINVVATHAEYAEQKPKAYAYRDELNSRGARASVHHSPVYHHTRRLKSKTGKGGSASNFEAVNEYVQAVDVDTNGLSQSRLIELGKQAVEAGRMRE